MRVRIIKNKGGLYTLYCEQEVNMEINKVWDFFTNIKNIEKIMPKEFCFKVTSGRSKDFHEGKIINFNTKILPFLSTNIISEIRNISPKKFFIDKQIFGPYKFWYHEHHFHKTNTDKTIIVDKIKYKLYFHPFSWIIHNIFIKEKLVYIFNYRNHAIQRILNNNISTY